MTENNVRLHVIHQGRRTTVSIHAHLFELVALYGSQAPDGDKAHLVVRLRCQNIIDRLERRGGFTGGQLSHILTAELLDVIASKKVMDRHEAWAKGNG